MSYNVEELNGDSRTLEDSEYDLSVDYYTAIHGYDNEPPGNCKYDELDPDQGNRWHIQSWLSERPTIESETHRGRTVEVHPSLVDIFYRVDADTKGGEFDSPNPSHSAIENGGVEYTESFNISFGATLGFGPLSVGLAAGAGVGGGEMIMQK